MDKHSIREVTLALAGLSENADAKEESLGNLFQTRDLVYSKKKQTKIGGRES